MIFLPNFKKEYLLLATILTACTIFMYFNPDIFPMHGYNGPKDFVVSPVKARLTGDSWRYIYGGYAILTGQPLEEIHHSYLGYCFVYGLAGGSIILLQTTFALVALAAVMALGRRLGGKWCGIIAGGAFAINTEFAAWHCAIMTESLYTSCVCISTYLAIWAIEKHRLWRMSAVFAWIMLTATLRPTGWIQLPAILIFWSYTLIPNIKWKCLAILAVILCYILLSSSLASKGIQQQNPVQKLYSGEVVWQEELWRVKMPEADFNKTDLSDGMIYTIQHPLATLWLATKRLGVMFLRIRPSYSTTHNIFLIAYHLPIALLGLAGILVKRKETAAISILAMLTAHAFVVAITFNDNDGRFTLYFTPILATAAAACALYILNKILSKIKILNLSAPSSQSHL